MHTTLSILTSKLQHLDSSTQFYLLNSEAKLKDFTSRDVIVERERERKRGMAFSRVCFSKSNQGT